MRKIKCTQEFRPALAGEKRGKESRDWAEMAHISSPATDRDQTVWGPSVQPPPLMGLGRSQKEHTLLGCPPPSSSQPRALLQSVANCIF